MTARKIDGSPANMATVTVGEHYLGGMAVEVQQWAAGSNLASVWVMDDADALESLARGLVGAAQQLRERASAHVQE